METNGPPERIASPSAEAGEHEPLRASLPSLRPTTKVGIVVGGLLAAFLGACLAVWIREKLTNGPDAQASSGMYAFGDLLLGLAIFGTLALIPFGLGLYWMRAVPRFWSLLAGASVLYLLTGAAALVVSGPLRPAAGDWALLADARLGLMAPGSLTLAVCGLFAPAGPPRWILIIGGLIEGGIIASLLVVKFILPQLAR
ncbi:MAG TPA: hypothetical protein VG734_21780 [Lacunisphaera sp.]|nr:hypothetical protein [Lacunisphaera sp.]